MTGNQRPLSLKARLGIAALTLTILVSAAGGGLVAIQPAKGIGIVEALVGRAIVRTISHKAEEKADRKAINQRRDAEKAEVNQQQQVLDFERGRDWLDQAAYQQESARLVALKKGIDERATRERQIVSFQTRNNIRNDLAGTVRDVLTVSTGMNPKAIDFAGSLLRGEKPITAAINAALAGGPQVVDPRQQFRELQQTLSEVEGGLRFVRDHRGILARAELARLLREMGGPDVTPKEAEEALNRARKLGEDVEKAVAQAGAIKKDLLPQSPGIDRQRFANNGKWTELNDDVQALKASKAGEAVLAGLLRAADERARERVEALLAGSGITLTDEELLAIAKEAGAKYRAERLKEGKVLDASAADIDEIMRRAVDEALAKRGLKPLATATPVTEATRTATPGATETVMPEETETATPGATETATPETTETATPKETETPPEETETPTPETTPTPEPKDVTAVGRWVNVSLPGLSLNTVTLRFNTAGGPVSGEGYVTSQIPPVSGVSCPPGTLRQTDIFEGTYSPDTGEFSGTWQNSAEGFYYVPIFKEDTTQDCEQRPYAQAPTSGSWHGTLQDGVVVGYRGAGESGNRFEVTVQGP